MESYFQEDDQVVRNGVPLPFSRMIRWAEMESLFQENDQVGRDKVHFQEKDQVREGLLFKRMISWVEMEYLFQENDHAGRDGVLLPRE
jgi:hypothetical protein